MGVCWLTWVEAQPASIASPKRSPTALVDDFMTAKLTSSYDSIEPKPTSLGSKRQIFRVIRVIGPSGRRRIRRKLATKATFGTVSLVLFAVSARATRPILPATKRSNRPNTPSGNETAFKQLVCDWASNSVDELLARPRIGMEHLDRVLFHLWFRLLFLLVQLLAARLLVLLYDLVSTLSSIKYCWARALPTRSSAIIATATRLITIASLAVTPMGPLSIRPNHRCHRNMRLTK